jgi:hypothetical protein
LRIRAGSSTSLIGVASGSSGVGSSILLISRSPSGCRVYQPEHGPTSAVGLELELHRPHCDSRRMCHQLVSQIDRNTKLNSLSRLRVVL